MAKDKNDFEICNQQQLTQMVIYCREVEKASKVSTNNLH